MNTLHAGGPSVLQEELSVEAVFAAQRATAIAQRVSSAKARAEKLQRLEEAVLAQRDPIRHALMEDLHRPVAETDLFELVPILSGLRHARRHLKAWMKPRYVPPTLAMFGTKARIRCEPKGVSLIIAPWNYPVSLLLGPLTSAIAAGCPAVLKPSEMTPATAEIMTRLIKATFDPREVAIFEGDAAVATKLLALPFDHIFFTGSPAVGKIVMQAAAQNLAAVTLELGGKSPVILDETADLRKAAQSICWGKFSNSGQTCIAPDYAYVHEKVLPAFLAAMKEVLARLYGEPAQTPDYCRIVNEKHFARITMLIDEAVKDGATIVVGGEREATQKFIAPTLLTGLTENMAILREEIFGPVLPVLPYRDLAEPIAAINARPKPLALYVYGKDQERIAKILRETSAGGSCINSCLLQFTHENLPFGGIGHSGLGHSHGIFGFHAFSHERAVLEDKFSLMPWLYPPYTPWVKRWIDWTLRYLA
ncbi:MAG TPA: aldehyde dehydrogenase family protein [Methylocella sp.]|nr:aldehyde dehydrogenase family protein [Methylocella sp.]